jgi:hypothetical protein
MLDALKQGHPPGLGQLGSLDVLGHRHAAPSRKTIFPMSLVASWTLCLLLTVLAAGSKYPANG